MIDVTLKVDAEEMSLTVIDDGHPFNPANHDSKISDGKMEDREIGGLGIYLIKKEFDRIHYRREAERNIVEIIARRKALQ